MVMRRMFQMNSIHPKLTFDQFLHLPDTIGQDLVLLLPIFKELAQRDQPLHLKNSMIVEAEHFLVAQVT
ncbi:hypothetical protein A6B37_04840 [Achromobacter sp. HZ01]|nr:hypothetical protein A6B37_04840 [Achromobacter sp. HZ01]